MTSEPIDPKLAALASGLSQSLVTRTLGQVAGEARQDGESLAQVVDRYEIDFAWHVLGAERTRMACLSALENRLGRTASTAQQADVVAVLAAAAAAQGPDVLMSFDNDVASLLSDLLSA